MRAEGESWEPAGVPAPVPGRSVVAQVMVTHPKVLPADAAAGRVRALFEDDHVHMVMLTDGSLLRGTVLRSDVPDTATDGQKAMGFARLTDRTVPATAPADAVLQWLAAREQRRLAVVDDGGLLVGLLCLKARGTGFCSNSDVAARAQERQLSVGGMGRHKPSADMWDHPTAGPELGDDAHTHCDCPTCPPDRTAGH